MYMNVSLMLFREKEREGKERKEKSFVVGYTKRVDLEPPGQHQTWVDHERGDRGHD